MEIEVLHAFGKYATTSEEAAAKVREALYGDLKKRVQDIEARTATRMAEIDATHKKNLAEIEAKHAPGIARSKARIAKLKKWSDRLGKVGKGLAVAAGVAGTAAGTKKIYDALKDKKDSPGGKSRRVAHGTAEVVNNMSGTYRAMRS